MPIQPIRAKVVQPAQFSTLNQPSRDIDMQVKGTALRVNTLLGDNDLLNREWYSNGWPRLDKNFYRFPDTYSFDVTEAREEAAKILEKYPARRFPLRGKGTAQKWKHSYRGVGLTSLPNGTEEDALNIYVQREDGLQVVETEAILEATSERSSSRYLPELDESMFTAESPAMTPYFSNLIKRFKSPVTKVRLLELKPGGVLASHVDFPYYRIIRIHSILETNDGVYWEVDGERRQLPIDGNFWWMDVGKYHSVWNVGKTSRWVLSINLAPFSTRSGSNQFLPREPAIPRLDLFDLIDNSLV